ncbi:hypothetical protein PN36_07605 [Candidatus Thiomargarita nelsonii]|uniref:Uncharacterized protein n=1 Tax=Candidatus Thiomargarita nelsonii TaxID=1003181 RepID=A0A0A6P620_9GAMM|nr:hypothetical protein PN36_07605 [Candidatus Thiomargarita nelsonii]
MQGVPLLFSYAKQNFNGIDSIVQTSFVVSGMELRGFPDFFLLFREWSYADFPIFFCCFGNGATRISIFFFVVSGMELRGFPYFFLLFREWSYADFPYFFLLFREWSGADFPKLHFIMALTP